MHACVSQVGMKSIAPDWSTKEVIRRIGASEERASMQCGPAGKIVGLFPGGVQETLDASNLLLAVTPAQGKAMKKPSAAMKKPSAALAAPADEDDEHAVPDALDEEYPEVHALDEVPAEPAHPPELPAAPASAPTKKHKQDHIKFIGTECVQLYLYIPCCVLACMFATGSAGIQVLRALLQEEQRDWHQGEEANERAPREAAVQLWAKHRAILGTAKKVGRQGVGQARGGHHMAQCEGLGMGGNGEDHTEVIVLAVVFCLTSCRNTCLMPIKMQMMVI